MSMFKQVLTMSRQQTEPQRLLFLFAETSASRKSRKRDDKKGTITPRMVVDKLPEELTDFAALVIEADSIDKDWDFVFIAALGGDESGPPSSVEAEPFLRQMTSHVETGSNIHRYVVLDRDETPIELMAD